VFAAHEYSGEGFILWLLAGERQLERPLAIWLLLCQNFNKKSFYRGYAFLFCFAKLAKVLVAKFHLWSS